MDAYQVVKILIFFRDIEKEIKFCRRIISDFEDTYYNAAGAVNYDEPIVQSGTTSNSTMRNALNLPDSVAPSCRQLEKFIADISKLKTEIFSELEKLSYIQKAVIYGFYVEQWQWAKISMKEHCSIRKCENERDKAIAKLGKNFSQNEVIVKLFQKK
jgi:hypothetical protein